jgi:hypothetical protein
LKRKKPKLLHFPLYKKKGAWHGGRLLTCQLILDDRFSTVTRKSDRVGGPYFSIQTGRVLKTLNL